jgi:hypothetical protein
MEHIEIVKKLIGPIDASGRSEVDYERLENLRALCRLTEQLIEEIHFASRNKISHEHSVKLIGQYAEKFLKNNIYVESF